MSLLTLGAVTDPRFSALSAGQDLADLPELVMWASAGTGFVNVTSTAIDRFVDRGGSGNRFDSSDPRRPLLTGAQFDGLSGAVFDGVNDLAGYTGTFDRSAPWTIAGIVKGSSGVILASYTGPGVLTSLQFGTNAITINHGNAFASAPYTYNTPALVIASSNGTRLSLSVGAVQAVPKLTDNNGGVSTLVMGALNGLGAGPMAGSIAELALFSADLRDYQNAAKLDVLQDFVRARYPSVPLPPL
jgi:hypothetical protein